MSAQPTAGATGRPTGGGARYWGVGYAVAALYLAAAVGTNWLVQRHGITSVGFGLRAPTGVYVVGQALVLRDVVQQMVGNRAAVVAMAVGTALSCLVANSAVATASALAFAMSSTLLSTHASRRNGRGPCCVVG